MRCGGGGGDKCNGRVRYQAQQPQFPRIYLSAVLDDQPRRESDAVIERVARVASSLDMGRGRARFVEYPCLPSHLKGERTHGSGIGFGSISAYLLEEKQVRGETAARERRAYDAIALIQSAVSPRTRNSIAYALLKRHPSLVITLQDRLRYKISVLRECRSPNSYPDSRTAPNDHLWSSRSNPSDAGTHSTVRDGYSLAYAPDVISVEEAGSAPRMYTGHTAQRVDMLGFGISSRGGKVMTVAWFNERQRKVRNGPANTPSSLDIDIVTETRRCKMRFRKDKSKAGVCRKSLGFESASAAAGKSKNNTKVLNVDISLDWAAVNVCCQPCNKPM
ncbi:uncharacterized protein MYCFIDRAFT_178167 [Pseudocercospora fijiensis CIRAD86]|uniref:Uncharacterized protein n=1 Tax=Pseudocercospora fijiensis (strain CIRAD86) TaxID=383855 RepID=M2YP86_PSEFD|nr:uncharacterized protein MYCFIDRAFT_178167 [Pseudocercospora fijiensis CIRAD86]EME79575.1 hypothetical protein MYCFIDRAFT_178167 [Pseudocercospora fijiensis CIRAD86]